MDPSTTEQQFTHNDELSREFSRTERIVNLIILANILLVVIAVVPTFVYWVMFLW